MSGNISQSKVFSMHIPHICKQSVYGKVNPKRQYLLYASIVSLTNMLLEYNEIFNFYARTQSKS